MLHGRTELCREAESVADEIRAGGGTADIVMGITKGDTAADLAWARAFAAHGASTYLSATQAAESGIRIMKQPRRRYRPGSRLEPALDDLATADLHGHESSTDGWSSSRRNGASGTGRRGRRCLEGGAEAFMRSVAQELGRAASPALVAPGCTRTDMIAGQTCRRISSAMDSAAAVGRA
ncbi:MAG: hypothetical protein R3E09_00500 [Novosphingobium sp.]